MELTYEEKLDKLKDYEGWLTFTDSQKVFLDAMARGMKPTEAFVKAYPNTKAASLVFASQQMLCKVGIRKALLFIGVDTRKPVVTKKEAQEILSRHLRKTEDPSEVVKLLSVYAKISGWEDEEENPEEEPDLDKLVVAVEKKRRKGKEDESSS